VEAIIHGGGEEVRGRVGFPFDPPHPTPQPGLTLGSGHLTGVPQQHMLIIAARKQPHTIYNEGNVLKNKLLATIKRY